MRRSALKASRELLCHCDLAQACNHTRPANALIQQSMGKQGRGGAVQPRLTQAARRVHGVATVRKQPNNYPCKYDLMKPLPSSQQDCIRMTKNASVHTSVGSIADLDCIAVALMQFTHTNIPSGPVAKRLEKCRHLLDQVDPFAWRDFADSQGGRLWLLRNGLVKVLW